MPLNAGLLNRRVTIQMRVASRDASGGVVETYTERATVWADARPMSGREVVAAGNLVASEMIEFTLRHRDDVEPTDRIVMDGRVFAIDYIAEIGLREGLRIVARRPAENAS